MKTDQRLIDAHDRALESVENLLGSTPEDYKILMFIDPSLYDSVLLQTERAGTPKAVISSNQLYVLQHLKEEDYVPSGKDLFYASRAPRLFFPNNLLDLDPSGKVAEAKMFQALVKAVFCEQTNSNFPNTLKKLYHHDTVIYDLFANNVYEFVMERGASWVWQYFQDFTAVMRVLSLYDLDDFYIPPTSIRDASIFYNYLLEIKSIIKERSQQVLKAPLMDLLVDGIGDLALNVYLEDKYDPDTKNQLMPYLKSNLGQPRGVIGAHFLKQRGEDLQTIFSEALRIENDQELTSIWNRGETKKELEEVRDGLSNKSMIWHAADDRYWSDLWPMRGSSFDKVANYVGKIQRRGYKRFSELQADSPIITDHGRVKLKDREVVVLGVNDDTVGQEQLIILRNHLQAKKDTFSTPLPGLPDTIIFKKMSGLHVASYLGVSERRRERRYPKSPYDLPVTVRAIQVTSRKGAYQSDEREEDGRIDEANYDDLKSLTEPQHRAIRYLIRQGEVTQ